MGTKLREQSVDQISPHPLAGCLCAVMSLVPPDVVPSVEVESGRND